MREIESNRDDKAETPNMEHEKPVDNYMSSQSQDRRFHRRKVDIEMGVLVDQRRTYPHLASWPLPLT